ncbi:hypothetical protein ACFO9Q_03315 [Paenibacillus sp. GCM10023252]|uniref:hypothetical protein n=1 Tax=Paenibacillus sp. GCM10023252 TaxID=3252649 RepID=UPI0036177466
MRSLLNSVGYLLWSAALIGLLFVASSVEARLTEVWEFNPDTANLLLLSKLLYFVLGIFISVLFIRGRKLQLNLPLLLFAFLPVLIVAIFSEWYLHELIPRSISSLVAGFLLLFLFSAKRGDSPTA